MGTSRRGDRTGRLLLYAAVLLLAAGLTVGGATAWGWWSRVRAVHTAQERLSQTLDARWAADGVRSTADPATGRPRTARPAAAMPFTGAARGTGPEGPEPIARLYLPTLAVKLVIVDGADEEHLRAGPGHIPGTANFGEPGNAGIAGHRYPGLFWNLDQLDIGAPVVVETRDSWLVYRVIDASVVRPEQDEVLAPPAPGAGPVLTLVTCEPKLSTARRLIRQATLVRRDPHTGARPAELN